MEFQHGQAVEQHFEIPNAQQLGDDGQAGPVDASHAVGQQRIGAAGSDVVDRGGRLRLSFPLDAGRMIEQVPQFPAAASERSARIPLARL